MLKAFANSQIKKPITFVEPQCILNLLPPGTLFCRLPTLVSGSSNVPTAQSTTILGQCGPFFHGAMIWKISPLILPFWFTYWLGVHTHTFSHGQGSYFQGYCVISSKKLFLTLPHFNSTSFNPNLSWLPHLHCQGEEHTFCTRWPRFRILTLPMTSSVTFGYVCAFTNQPDRVIVRNQWLNTCKYSA